MAGFESIAKALLTSTALVLANDCPSRVKMAAKLAKYVYGSRIQVCDGVADDVEIAIALSALPDFTGDPAGTKTGRVIVLGHVINLASQLVLGPFHDAVFDARDVAFTGAGIKIDSIMDAWIYLGVVGGSTGQIALDFKPTTTGPDNFIIANDSRIYISAIAGETSPLSGSVGLRAYALSGTIQRMLLDIGVIWGFEKLIHSPNPGGGKSFDRNVIKVRGLYTGTTAVQDGDAGAGGHTFNHYELSLADELTNGVMIYGDDSYYLIKSVTGPAAANALILQSGATRNTIVSPPLAGYTDNSGNTTNRIIAPNFQISGTATITAAATTVVVTHGLAATPTRVFVSPTLLSSSNKWWVTTIGATTFTINVDVVPGAGTAIFDWRAQVGEG